MIRTAGILQAQGHLGNPQRKGEANRGATWVQAQARSLFNFFFK